MSVKYLVLKTVKQVFDDNSERDFDYKIQLTNIMRSPMNPQGVDIEDMEKSLKVLSVLKDSGNVLKLEDADYDWMKRKVESTKWGMVHQIILDFVRSVQKPLDHEPLPEEK